jgi:hypothetical protein
MFPLDSNELTKFGIDLTDDNVVSMLEYVKYGWIPIGKASKPNKPFEDYSLVYIMNDTRGTQISKTFNGMKGSTDMLLCITELLSTTANNAKFLTDEYDIETSFIGKPNDGVTQAIMKFVDANFGYNYIYREIIQPKIMRVRYIDRPLDFTLAILNGSGYKIQWHKVVEPKYDVDWVLYYIPKADRRGDEIIVNYKSRTGLTTFDLNVSSIKKWDAPSGIQLYTQHMVALPKHGPPTATKADLHRNGGLVRCLLGDDYYHIKIPVNGACGYHVLQIILGIQLRTSLALMGTQVTNDITSEFQEYLEGLVSTYIQPNQKTMEWELYSLISFLILHSLKNFAVLCEISDDNDTSISSAFHKYTIGPPLKPNEALDFLLVYEVKGQYKADGEFSVNSNGNHYNIYQSTNLPEHRKFDWDYSSLVTHYTNGIPDRTDLV